MNYGALSWLNVCLFTIIIPKRSMIAAQLVKKTERVTFFYPVRWIGFTTDRIKLNKCIYKYLIPLGTIVCPGFHKFSSGLVCC